MSIFLITPLGKNFDRLSTAVKGAFSEQDRFELQNDAGWLVNFTGTSLELSNRVGITGHPKGEPHPIGSAVVTVVSSYYGRGPADMWEWLKTRFESQ